MRIAVLFFGQPRFFDLSKEFIKNEFTFDGHTTDYFAHLWDSVGYTPDGEEHETPGDVRSILVKDFEAKSFKIDNYSKINNICKSFKTIFNILKAETNQNIPVSEEEDSLRYKFSQHYSLGKAFERLKDYEKLNGVKYDIIIKARTDIIYSVPKLYKDLEQYNTYKNKTYLNLPTDMPAMMCNGLRIIDGTNFNEQFVNSFFNKKIRLFLSQKTPLPFEYTWRYRLAFNDWSLITNRKAADIMFAGWFTSYFQALGWDIDQLNMLADKKSVKNKLKIVSNSEHALQGFMAYKNNINTYRVQPHRRDYRLLKGNEIKRGVDSSGKIYVEHKDAIIPTMSRIFKHRYPEFYE